MNRPGYTESKVRAGKRARKADPPTRKERVIAGVLCFCLFMLVYILSVGPMAALHEEAVAFSEFQGALETVYAPLIVIVESDVQPVSGLLKWYIGLFR